MKVKKRRIQYFEDYRKKQPFRKWLSKLKDKKAKAKIDVCIRRTSLGNFGDHKFVGDSIIELRVHYGPGYRVYLSVTNNDEIIILLVGGEKSTQDQDIQLAKSRLKEWRKRNE